jgi:rsbT co-antagonist protein RsbR
MIDGTSGSSGEASELASLRQRVEELERAQEQAERLRQRYEAIIQRIPVSISILRADNLDDPRSFRQLEANPAAAQAMGFDLSAETGKLLTEIYPGILDEVLTTYADVLRSGRPRDLGELTAADERVGGIVMQLHAVPLPDGTLCLIFENVTERKRAEAMYRENIALEEAIRAQNATMAELSTPLIPISDEVMVMPLIGTVDSRRAQQVMEALLEGIAERGAATAILDITGVPVVDTQVANALIRAAQAVKLLGAEVILTGIRPEVAQTLVGLGADLQAITTLSSLQSGIAYATQRR